MTLYLKYRPKNLDELDLPEVSQSLKKIVISKNIPHAFLFAGPKGTGKTSAARILAKIINCENLSKDGVPCDKCDQCLSITKGTNLDVIEMDAASHRGIDDVRTLRDAVKLAPTKAEKKIYIIDEAHMLTTEACNALLKTLEEPPDHVIFILATTNPEKLIDTIRSRATLISFRKATPGEISKSLKRVIDAEKIKITEESILKIANISGGAFRDAIKILEQYVIEGEKYLDIFKTTELDSFIEFIVKKDQVSAIAEVEKNISLGVSMEVFLSDFLQRIHQAILADNGLGKGKINGLGKEDLMALSDIFIQANGDLSNSPIEQLPVEIGIIKWCGSEKQTLDDNDVSEEQKDEMDTISNLVEDKKSVEVKKEEEPFENKSEDNIDVPKKDESAPASNEGNITKQEVVGVVNDDIWKKILSEIHPVNISIEGLLRSSRPLTYDGNTLTLGVFYKFHKERLEESSHRKILESVMEKVLNCPTRVICTLVEPPAKVIVEEAKHEPVLTESAEPDIIKAAEEIFGS